MSDTVSEHGQQPRIPAPWRLVATLGLLTLLSWSGVATADERPTPLDATVKAWEARSADKVVALMAPKGRLTLQLTTPAVSGSFQRQQAQRTLKQYFEQVASIKLVDVTPRDHRETRGFKVRFYDYTYQPKGRDPTKRQLVITMKAAGAKGWHLDSVRERPRRR